MTKKRYIPTGRPRGRPTKEESAEREKLWIRSLTRRGARKTGKVPFEKIQMVMQNLEEEAYMSHKEQVKLWRSLINERYELHGDDVANLPPITIGTWRTMLLIGIPLYTGYRSIDCRLVRWNQLVFLNHAGMMEVRPTLLTRERKTSKRREAPINDDLALYIIRCFQETRPKSLDEYVFKHRDKEGEAMTRRGYAAIIGGAFARFGIYEGSGYVAPHSLRKSYAWYMYEKLGGDHTALLQLQVILNHASIEDTINYLDLTLDAATKAQNEISFRSPGVAPVNRDFGLLPRR